jgi:hypothetical protein
VQRGRLRKFSGLVLFIIALFGILLLDAILTAFIIRPRKLAQ